MNFAYITHSGDVTRAIGRMLVSLDEHCDCTLLCLTPSLTPTLEQQFRSHFRQPIEFLPIPEDRWVGQRMARKIWELERLSFATGDRVFVLDTDLLIQADIFEGVNGTFDVGLTSRHYDYWYKVNAGVWSFEANDRSREFLKFFASEIREPRWQPFVEFRERFRPLRPASLEPLLDWWCDQDLLSVAYEQPPPLMCRIGDMGYRYNFCPSVEDDVPGSFERARDEILAKLGDTDIKVLHFKGRLKEVLEGLGGTL